MYFTDSMCKENQTYQEGGYDCATCKNFNFVSCKFQDKAGCYCKPGFIWDSHFERCILITECP